MLRRSVDLFFGLHWGWSATEIRAFIPSSSSQAQFMGLNARLKTKRSWNWHRLKGLHPISPGRTWSIDTFTQEYEENCN
jgi:hypothetical protein